MPARRMLTKAQRMAREKAIIKDLKAGQLSYRRIALKHKVSLPTVNSKARKAGITRSRRGPAALAAPATMRAKRTVARRKVGRRVAARKAVLRTKVRVAVRRKVAARKVRRYVARAVAARRMAAGAMTRGRRGSRAFREQFRTLVMFHYPNISLKLFDRLTSVIERSLP
jgi:hypothetical protein